MLPDTVQFIQLDVPETTDETEGMEGWR